MAVSSELSDSNIDLSGSVIPGADLSGANLTAANLENANLAGANLSFAVLKHAKMANSVLQGADLREADLTEADFTKANLKQANLRGADLNGANLSFARLDQAQLSAVKPENTRGLDWSDLLGAHIDEETAFPDELEEDSLFEYLDRVFGINGIDWRAECDGELKTLIQILDRQIQNINEKIPKSDGGWTITRYLGELKLHKERPEHRDT